MWSLLVAFLNLAMGQVFRTLIIKFVVFTALVLIVGGLAVLVFNYLVEIDLFGLSNLLQSLPDGLLFFLTVFQFHVGLPLLLGGMAARFAIRRIPLVG